MKETIINEVPAKPRRKSKNQQLLEEHLAQIQEIESDCYPVILHIKNSTKVQQEITLFRHQSIPEGVEVTSEIQEVSLEMIREEVSKGKHLLVLTKLKSKKRKLKPSTNFHLERIDTDMTGTMSICPLILFKTKAKTAPDYMYGFMRSFFNYKTSLEFKVEAKDDLLLFLYMKDIEGKSYSTPDKYKHK